MSRNSVFSFKGDVSTVDILSQFFQRPISFSKCRSYTLPSLAAGSVLARLFSGYTMATPGPRS